MWPGEKMWPGENRVWYLDTSIVLRIALGHSAAAQTWYEQRLGAGDALVASRLTALESIRVLRRENLSLDLADEVLGFATMLSVDGALLAEAAGIGRVVKSLDALHLASAMRVGVAVVTVVTHDAAMIRVAKDLGFEVCDPVLDDGPLPA